MSILAPILLLLLLLPIQGLQINVTRLTTHLTTLSTHNDLTPPAVQRIIYTPSDIASRAYLTALFESAGLHVRTDPIGNIFATWSGTSDQPGVLTGSHFDAIPNSGMFDGTLGILSALEAFMSLREAGFVPARSITIVAFTSEEPTRFGLSCIGSRLLAGTIKPEELFALNDSSGVSFDAARSAAGYTGDLDGVPLNPGEYSAFLELHSEQGPLLEQASTAIGVVTDIAAPAAMMVTFSGPGGHAGTELMRHRKDPSLAAAELSLSVEGAVLRYGGDDTVGTTGFLEIVPNAVNSVPTVAKVSVDVRDIVQERRDLVLSAIENVAHLIAQNRGVQVDVVYNSRDPPAKCSEEVVEAVADVANQNGLSIRKMVSRAYHDALFMAGVVPTGMIFVPCRNGVSHRPDEFVAQADMENGVRVLAGVLKRLAGDAVEERARGLSTESPEFPEPVEESAEFVHENLASSATESSEDSELKEGPTSSEVKSTGAVEQETREPRDDDSATSVAPTEPESPGLPRLTETVSDEVRNVEIDEREDDVSSKRGTTSSRRRTNSRGRSDVDAGEKLVVGSVEPVPSISSDQTAFESKETTSIDLREPNLSTSKDSTGDDSKKITDTGSMEPETPTKLTSASYNTTKSTVMGSVNPTRNVSRRSVSTATATASTSPVNTASTEPPSKVSEELADKERKKPAFSAESYASASRERKTSGSTTPEALFRTEPIATDADTPRATSMEEEAVFGSQTPIAEESEEPAKKLGQNPMSSTMSDTPGSRKRKEVLEAEKKMTVHTVEANPKDTDEITADRLPDWDIDDLHSGKDEL